MALFNYATKEITLKIVYYGPGLSGKTTNLQHLHSVLNPETKGKLLSLSTESDRTLFFDFLPVELGKIRDFSIRFQLYTVPGQVRYNATRKVVLKGADAVVFVADSQNEMREQNIESFSNMRENLYSNNINPDEIPIILQYNKRDLQNISTIEELNNDLNQAGHPVIEASAITGTGVEDSFRLITRLLLKYISQKHKIEIQPIPGNEEPEKSEAAVPVREHILETTATGTVNPVSEAAFEEAPENKRESVKEKIRESLWKAEAPFAGKPPAPDSVKEVMEAHAVAPEKIDMIAGELISVNETLTVLKNAVALFNRDIKGIKKEQEETNSILRNLVRIFEDLKTRKSWFKF